MADTDNNIQNNPPIDPNKPNKVYPWKRHDYMVPDHRAKHIPQDNYDRQYFVPRRLCHICVPHQ